MRVFETSYLAASIYLFEGCLVGRRRNNDGHVKPSCHTKHLVGISGEADRQRIDVCPIRGFSPKLAYIGLRPASLRCQGLGHHPIRCRRSQSPKGLEMIEPMTRMLATTSGPPQIAMTTIHSQVIDRLCPDRRLMQFHQRGLEKCPSTRPTNIVPHSTHHNLLCDSHSQRPIAGEQAELPAR